MVPSTGIGEIQQSLLEGLGVVFVPSCLAPAVYCLQCMAHNLVVVFFAHDADTQFIVDRASVGEARIIYLYEDDWMRKREIILGRLKACVGKATRIYARECALARLDKQEAIRFLRQNHLQVPLAGKYRYGLLHKGQLVAVAVFGGARRMYREHGAKYRSFELIRNCNRNGYVVVGGLSKLLKRFAGDFRPDDIMTYVDRDWSDGASFAKLGFERVGITQMHGFWVDRYSWERMAVHGMDDGQLQLDKAGYYYVQNRGSLKMVHDMHGKG